MGQIGQRNCIEGCGRTITSYEVDKTRCDVCEERHYRNYWMRKLVEERYDLHTLLLSSL